MGNEQLVIKQPFQAPPSCTLYPVWLIIYVLQAMITFILWATIFLHHIA